MKGDYLLNIAYIMRGVQGSGKSTLARKLIEGGGIIHSTDDFFLVDGEYRFNPQKLGEYHNRNYQNFCRSLRDNVPIVVCDNVNAKRWHFERYANSARNAGYIVAFLIMPHPNPEVAAKRTVHNVPSQTIRRIIEEWEN